MSDYTELHRDSVLQMLNLADELPLFVQPNTLIDENPFLEQHSSSDISETDSGVSKPPASNERLSLFVEQAKGRMNLITLGGMAAIELVGEEISRHFPESQTMTSPTPEQLQQGEGIVQHAKNEIQGSAAQYMYAKYGLDTPGLNETTDITTSGLIGTSGLVAARILSIEVCDDFIKRTLKVNELPTSFSGDTTLKITQSIEPILDESLNDATEFFLHNGTDSDLGIVFNIFRNELLGKSNELTTELLDRYENTPHTDKVLKIIEDIKSKAAARKAQSRLVRNNPSITQPSTVELEEYISLLKNMRA